MNSSAENANESSDQHDSQSLLLPVTEISQQDSSHIDDDDEVIEETDEESVKDVINESIDGNIINKIRFSLK